MNFCFTLHLLRPSCLHFAGRGPRCPLNGPNRVGGAGDGHDSQAAVWPGWRERRALLLAVLELLVALEEEVRDVLLHVHLKLLPLLLKDVDHGLR